MNKENLRTAICISDWELLKSKEITAIHYTKKISRSLCSCGFYSSKLVSICPDCGNNNFTEWPSEFMLRDEIVNLEKTAIEDTVSFFTKTFRLVESGKELTVKVENRNLISMNTSTFAADINTHYIKGHKHICDQIIELFLSSDEFFPELNSLKDSFRVIGLELNSDLFATYENVHNVPGLSVLALLKIVYSNSNCLEFICSEEDKVVALGFAAYIEMMNESSKSQLCSEFTSKLLIEVCESNLKLMLEAIKLVYKLGNSMNYHKKEILAFMANLDKLEPVMSKMLLEEWMVGNIDLGDMLKFATRISGYEKGTVPVKTVKEIIRTYGSSHSYYDLNLLIEQIMEYKDHVDENSKAEDIVCFCNLDKIINKFEKPYPEKEKARNSFMTDPMETISQLSNIKDI